MHAVFNSFFNYLRSVVPDDGSGNDAGVAQQARTQAPAAEQSQGTASSPSEGGEEPRPFAEADDPLAMELKTAVADVIHSRNELRSDIHDKDKTIERLEEELDDKIYMVNKLMAKIEELSDEMDHVKDELAQLMIKHSHLQENYEELQTAFRSKTDSLKDELAQERQTYKSLRKDFDRHRQAKEQQLAGLEETISKEQAAKEHLAAKYNELERANKALERHIMNFAETAVKEGLTAARPAGAADDVPAASGAEEAGEEPGEEAPAEHASS